MRGENMNRMGKFVLPFGFFEGAVPTFDHKLLIFERILIIESRTNFCNQTIEYMAISDLFEEVPDGMIAPLYECFISIDVDEKTNEENFSYEWKRID